MDDLDWLWSMARPDWNRLVQVSEPILLFSHTHEAGTTTALNHYTPESLHALSTLESKDADATDPSMSSCLPTQCEVGPDMAVLRTPESRRTPPSLTLEALIRKLNITSGTDTYHVMHWPRTSHADSPSPDSDTDHDDSFEVRLRIATWSDEREIGY